MRTPSGVTHESESQCARPNSSGRGTAVRASWRVARVNARGRGSSEAYGHKVGRIYKLALVHVQRAETGDDDSAASGRQILNTSQNIRHDRGQHGRDADAEQCRAGQLNADGAKRPKKQKIWRSGAGSNRQPPD